MDKDTAKKALVKLIKHFENESFADLLEEPTKKEFIEPLLKDVLGWNVNNHKEVGPEHRTSRGKVDYSLKLNEKPELFIEAKALKDGYDIDKHIEQAYKYAYNYHKVFFILLTNFQRLMLFDLTIPKDFKNLKKGLKLDLKCDEYLERFDDLWKLSKDSIESGSLDELIYYKPKGKKLVEKGVINDLLNDLRKWRDTLAMDIFRNNPKLFHHSEDLEKDSNFLKEITQKLLDRIIFIRSCEDRGLIEGRHLKELFEERSDTIGAGTMRFLATEFAKFNRIFNSDLFRHQDWEDELAVDFSLMKNIVLKTYDPYEFDVIPLEILGNIYEQYLSYDIRVTNHMVKRGLKTGIKKAKGIFYTPEYIVEYIIKNTVGRYLEKPSLRRVENLKILDPACGSGSFLIKAYDEMLNYYKNLRSLKSKSDERQNILKIDYKEMEPKLTLEKKSEILLKHIFGVDIDEQAVEITKLSLMLKMLEGEHTIISGRAVLPILDQNIACGNSLIEKDFLADWLQFDDKEVDRIKPFSWKGRFPRVMNTGGFNCIIGNPPYRSLLLGKKRKSEEDSIVRYYKSKLPNSSQYKINYFGLFIEKVIKDLLSKSGYFSFIIPNLFFTSHYFNDLRLFSIKGGNFIDIFDLRYKVFGDAEIGGNGIFVFTKNIKSIDHVKIRTANNLAEFSKPKERVVSWNYFKKNAGVSLLIEKGALDIFSKIKKVQTTPLGKICKIYQGIITGNNGEYLASKPLGKKWEKIFRGRDINRYCSNFSNTYILFDKRLLWSNTDEKMFKVPEKIISRQTSDRLIATLDTTGSFSLDSTHVIHLREKSYSLKYILGLFNSKLFNYLYTSKVKESGRPFAQVKIVNLETLPVRAVDFSKQHEKKYHDKLVSLVEEMLEFQGRLNLAKKETERDIYRGYIVETDEEIDNLIYDLYGITGKERQAIEESMNNA